MLQHEETLPKDIRDRLKLSRQCLAQFGQIFVIYPDPEGVIDSILMEYMKEKPLIDLIDDQGVRHRLWKVDGEIEVDRLQANLMLSESYSQWMTRKKIGVFPPFKYCKTLPQK